MTFDILETKGIRKIQIFRTLETKFQGILEDAVITTLNGNFSECPPYSPYVFGWPLPLKTTDFFEMPPPPPHPLIPPATPIPLKITNPLKNILKSLVKAHHKCFHFQRLYTPVTPSLSQLNASRPDLGTRLGPSSKQRHSSKRNCTYCNHLSRMSRIPVLINFVIDDSFNYFS